MSGLHPDMAYGQDDDCFESELLQQSTEEI